MELGAGCAANRSGLSAIPLEEVDVNVEENKSTEVSEAVAAVQLWLCIICACQAPLFRPFRRARRRAWQALRSPLISITLLSGAVVILPARKLLGEDRLQKM